MTCSEEQGAPPSGSLEQEQQKRASSSPPSNPEGHPGLTNPSPTPWGLSSAPLTPPQGVSPSLQLNQSGHSLPSLPISVLLLLKTEETKCHYHKGRHWLAPNRSMGVAVGSPGSRNFSPVSKAKIAQNSIWSWSVGTVEELLALVLDYSPAPRCARASEGMNEVGIDGALKVKYMRGWIGQGHVQRPRSRH